MTHRIETYAAITEIKRNERIFREREQADFIRQMVRALGERLPIHWTDEQVVQFGKQLVEEGSR